MKIVFNTSPLIFLSRLDFLNLFLNAPAHFYLPEAVREEIAAKRDETSAVIENLIASQNLTVKSPRLSSLTNRLKERLGKGEAEAISLATELQAEITLLDDLAARREAQRLGLKVKGTLAVIRKLHRERKIRIENLERLYQQLREINFRVKRELFESIFED